MKKIEAPTLQEAYTKASEELGCSITDLDFEIVQSSSKGFLGLFKKNAIIIAKCKGAYSPEPAKKRPAPQKTPRSYDSKPNTKPAHKAAEPQPVSAQSEAPRYVSKSTDTILDTFNQGFGDVGVLEEIEAGINALFAQSCFDVSLTEVDYYDEKTVKVKFDGPDAALLIGKEGYRYKALSYMLFNWINPKYNLLLRLEIAEFLENQEDQVRKYLEPIKKGIERYGKGQTKPLDGVLVQIALKELRVAFPDKYVAIRNNSIGEKYIIVNEFANRR